MALEHIKQITIRSYLEKKGIKPIKENETRGMYHSPLRMDTNASFSVNYSRNLWYDHGLGQGGSIVELVAKNERISIGAAITILESDDFSFNRQQIIPIQRTDQVAAITILTIAELNNPALLNYLSKRCIDPQIAKSVCYEVHYSVKGKSYFAIGFRNDNKIGVELRSKYFKGCTSKNTTSIKTGHEDCLLFEGFFDYLSYLTIIKMESPPTDVIVLNSLSNLSKVKNTLAEYRNVIAFLDNDSAGKKAIQVLQENLNNVIDQSFYYANYKDLNEYLCAGMTTERSIIEFTSK